jgi:hypothetical protein
VLQLKLEQLKEFEKQIIASKRRIHDELNQFAQQEKTTQRA